MGFHRRFKSERNWPNDLTYLELAQCDQLKSAWAVQFHCPKSIGNQNNVLYSQQPSFGKKSSFNFNNDDDDNKAKSWLLPMDESKRNAVKETILYPTTSEHRMKWPKLWSILGHARKQFTGRSTNSSHLDGSISWASTKPLVSRIKCYWSHPP